MYHGTHVKERVNGMEWLAFEIEHAEMFAREFRFFQFDLCSWCVGFWGIGVKVMYYRRGQGVMEVFFGSLCSIFEN